MDKFIQKQIKQMKTDIFPLDRMLPLGTVYNIFKDEYEKVDNKRVLFKNRKYQRLREGYFAMFVVAALNEWEEKEHFLQFPKDNNNDINILSIKEMDEKCSKCWKLICDVKEFTHYSKSFKHFLQQTIASKIGIYHLIVGTHIDIPDIRPLLNFVQDQESIIWVVSSPTKEDYNYNIGLVTMMWGQKQVEQKLINLSKDLRIEKNEPSKVFQNLLRDKLV